MFNPRYAQLLQQKGLATSSLNSNLIPTANPIARTLNTSAPITPQPAIRQQGFGTRIERTKKPKEKTKKKRKTKKKNKK